MEPNPPALPAQDQTFEQALAELEQIVCDLEESGISLEESLARYERGVGLLKHCYARLRQAEQRILLVTGTDEEGKALLQPFQHASTARGR
jgi:exodeoxyribonuclease VII small subunit